MHDRRDFRGLVPPISTSGYHQEVLEGDAHLRDRSRGRALIEDSILASVAQPVPLVVGEMGEYDCAHGYIDSLIPRLDRPAGAPRTASWMATAADINHTTSLQRRDWCVAAA